MRSPVPFLSVLWLLPGAATAQVFIQSESPGAYIPLASISGIQNVTSLDFSGNDEGSATVTLPFTYSYLGQPVTEVGVYTNGVVTFGPTSVGYTNGEIGSSSDPNNAILVWWDDLILPSATGNSDTGILGTAPNRVFIIEVRNWERWSLQNRNDGNWQVWLHEGPTGRFEVRYDGILTNSEGYSATIGWEGSGGTPSSAFRPCSEAWPYCNDADFATLVGTIFAVDSSTTAELVGEVGPFARGALPGDQAYGDITISNLGIVSASTVTCQLYLSTDDVLDASDTSVGQHVFNHLPPFDVPITVNATVTVPLGFPAGDFHLLFEVDSPNTVPELGESDNVSVASSLFATAFDPTPVDVTAPPGAHPGQTIDFDITINNSGVPFVGLLSIRVHASADPIYDINDPIVGSTKVFLPGTPVGNILASFTLPALPPDAYYPIVVVDHANMLVEIDEFNNTLVGATTFTSGSDLAPTDVTPDAQATAGQPFAVVTQISSLGAPYNGLVTYDLYLSADQTLDAADQQIGTYSVTFASETTIDDSRNPTFPFGLPPGAHYVIAVVDPSGVIAEANETNNELVGNSVRSGPDFRPLSITFSPGTVRAGEGVLVNATIRNNRSPHVGSVLYHIYFSDDSWLDAQDILVHNGSVFVNAAQDTALTATVAITSQIPAGVWRVFVEVDPDDLIPESSETNNDTYASSTLTVNGANLVVQSFTGAAQAFLTMPYTINLGFLNDDVVEASSFRYGYYLTGEGGVNPPQGQLFLSNPMSLAANTSTTITDQVIFTQTATSAQIAVVLDVFDNVLETTEVDNTGYLSTRVEILPLVPNLQGEIVERFADLVATPTIAAAGEDYFVGRILENDGVADAPSFSYTYYFSVNPTIATDDYALATFTSSLAMNESSIEIDQLNVPASIPAGVYYVGMLLDATGRVRESNESDNSVLGPLVTVYGASLTIADLDLPFGMIGVPYESYVYAHGGTIAPTFSVLSGSLPSGLSLSSSTGAITGIPTAEDTFPFRVRVTSDAAFAERDFVVRIISPTLPLTVGSVVLPMGFVGRPYLATLIALGGVPPYRWEATSSLPVGFTITSSGSINGTPTSPGEYKIDLRVTDSMGESAEGLVGLSIISPNQTVVITQSPLPSGILDVPYCAEEVIRFYATGGVPPYSWSILGETPPGMQLATNGEICGTPATVADVPIVVRAADANGTHDTSLFIFRVLSGDSLAVSTVGLPDAIIGQAYDEPLSALGGMEPYQWAIALGQLPDGLQLDPDGTISGVPTVVGSFAFGAQVSDAKMQMRLQPLSISVVEDTLATDEDEGCGCTATERRVSGAWFFLLVLLLLRRR